MSSINDKLHPLAKIAVSHTRIKSEKLWGAEARVLQLETREPMAVNIQSVEKKVEAHTKCIEELEKGERQKNTHIFGILENMEGRNGSDYFEHWLPTFLGLEIQ